MNGHVVSTGLSASRLRSLEPHRLSAVPVRMSANARWLALLLIWLCTAPTLANTPYKFWYAFGLAGFAVLWCMSRVGSFNALGLVLARPGNWALVLGLFGTMLSTAISPNPVRAGDLFQLARECYLVFVFAFLCVITQQIEERQLDAVIHRFVIAFLSGAILLCLLQRLSPFVFDVLLNYYYIQAIAGAEGYMRTRPGLTFGNPNAAAMAISFVSILGLTRARASLPTTAFILITGMAGILWTSSRTALFAHTATLLLIVVTYNPRLALAALAAGFAALFVLPFVMSDQASEWINHTWNRVANDRSSFNERQSFWELLLVNSDWRNSPLFGLGPSTEEVEVADSGYILSLYRYGYFGLAAYVLWPASLCCQGLRNFLERRHSDLAIRQVSVIVCFLIASYAMAPLTDPRLCTLYLFIVATAQSRERVAS